MTDLIKTAKTLIEKAEKATPGPWVNRPHGVVQSQSVSHIVFWDDEAKSKPSGEENYTYISMSDPTTITAICRLLLEYHEALEKINGDRTLIGNPFRVFEIASKALAAAGKGGEAG